MRRLLPAVVLAAISFGIAACSTAEYAEGHGTSSETFPPVELNGRQVALEVSSSAPPPPETTGRPPTGIKPGEDLQIGMALIDFDTGVTLRDVTFHISAELGDRHLFSERFEADGGFLVFNLRSSEESGDTTITDGGSDSSQEYDVLSFLLGAEKRIIHVEGPRLSDGGLYKFDITVETAGDYAEPLENPLTYSSGISIPQITTYAIGDPNFGDQYIRVITYYDEITDFEYDSESREIRYNMPFEWSDENIDQSYVVHEEISVPDTFGDLLVSGFDARINGVRIPDDTAIIDDFFAGERIVHFIIPQELLYDIRDEADPESDTMQFVIRPDTTDHTRLASVTENGQFRIFASWSPEDLRSGQPAKVMFELTDVFLKNAPVAAEYRVSMTKDGTTIFEQTGTSSDSRQSPVNVAEFDIPAGMSGIASLNFEDIDGNERARTSVPIVIDRVPGSATVREGTLGVQDVRDSADDQTQGGGNAADNGMGGAGGGGCLIATAAYGSELAPQIQQLRELRDNTVLATESGAAFMSGFNTVYYAFSPAVADLQREYPVLKEATRIALSPMLSSLALLEHADIDTEYEMLSYGLSIIMLNVAMYGAPVAGAGLVAKLWTKRRDAPRQ